MNRAMTVTQLSAYLKGVFDDEELLHDVTLTGEAAEVSYSDRHTYVVLAEGEYSVRCVHFSAHDSIEKGTRVALRGSVRFYDKRTGITFAFTEFFVCGDGEKAARLDATKKKLAALGYFENRPQLPRYIADVTAVTSVNGAAIRDLIRVVSAKNPFVRIHVYPAKMQGDGAADRIRGAVEALQTYNTDAIVLCRGGGSDEDLDSFNDEALAVAVARSRIPVISAVGHEVDYTLCDFCAGTRAGTPSIAGDIINAHAAAIYTDAYELICTGWNTLVDKYAALRGETARLGHDITRAAYSLVGESVRVTDGIMRRACYAVERKYERDRTRLAALCSRLSAALDGLEQRKRVRTDKLAAVLGALDPSRAKPGYAAVFVGGKSVSGVASLSPGDKVTLRFADGEASATVNKIKPI